jgi:NAD(P)-dependent dehydrogenase (short-subunit alcohol dehydrogenase family)
MGEERVAVVTGAAQGIGRRTAEVLAEEGYRLAVIDRRPVEGFEALSFVGDVSDEGDVERFVAEVEAAYGRADVLVNNAGIASIAPAEETTAAQWRQVIDVNLTGPFLLCQAFGRRMLVRGTGSIVNIASVAGLMGVADRVAYNASKLRLRRRR